MSARSPESLIDTHVHLWDPARAGISWPPGQGLPKTVTPGRFADACAGINVESYVFVEAAVDPGQHLREAEWVAKLANSDRKLATIVAHAPLEQGAAIESDLERLAAMPEVKGVRRLIQHEPDDAFCLTPEFLEGVRALARHGLHFEICVFHRQLGNALEMVRRCPKVAFVLDHLGKPGVKDGLSEPWREHVADLAKLHNVTCKLSGVATEADHARWTEDQLRPYIDHALQSFGPDRVMFGSDWPVSTLAIGYKRWVEVVANALQSYSDQERDQVWRGTARKTYRLG